MFRLSILCLSVLWSFAVGAQEAQPALAPSSTAVPSSSEMVGMVVSLKGAATVQRASGERVPLKLRARVSIGDRLETAFASSLQINFLDRSKIQLAGSSDYTIEAYAFVEGKEGRFEGRMQNGALSFMAGKVGKLSPKKFKIRTEMATVGIRGSSGQIQASDGTLPGVPPSFQVVKRAGIGLTADLKGAALGQAPILMEINGRGLVIEGPGQTRELAFSRSILQSYSASVEQQIASARQKVEETHKSIGIGTGPSMLASKTSSGGQPKQGEVTVASTGTALATGQEISTEIPTPAVLAADSENKVLAGPALNTAVAIRGVVQGLASTSSRITEQQLVSTHERALIGQSQEIEAAKVSKPGIFVGLMNSGAPVTVYEPSVALTLNLLGRPVDKALSIYLPQSDKIYEMNELPFASAAGQIAMEDFLTQGPFSYDRQFDSNSAMSLITVIRESGSDAVVGTVLSTQPSKQGDLPSSGQAHFSSDTRSSSSTEGGGVPSALALQSGAVEYPGLSTDGVVDWNDGKMALTLIGSSHGLNEGTGSENSGSSPVYGLLTGTFDASGKIATARAYFSQGFGPSHVLMPGSLNVGSPSYGLSRTSYSDYTGSGSLCGTNAEAVYVSLSDGNAGAILATGRSSAAHAWLMDEGTYTGYGYGFHVSGAAADTVAVSHLSTLTLTPSFTARTLSLGFDIDGVTGVVKGSDWGLVDREYLYSSLEGDSALSLGSGANFLCTVPLPETSLSGAVSKPSSVMWGVWNCVGPDGSGIYYPGRHNFWVAGKSTVVNDGGATLQAKLSTAGTHIEYRGQVQQSYVDRDGDYFSDANLPYGSGWNPISLTTGERQENTSPFAGVSIGTPVVGSNTGAAHVLVDLESARARGMAWIGNDTVLVYKSDTGSVTTGGISGTVTAMRFNADNNESVGVFTSDLPGGSSHWTGGFCGAGAASLAWKYRRNVSSGADVDIVGVGVAGQTIVYTAPPNCTLQAFMEGAEFEAVPHSSIPSGSPTLLSTPDLSIQIFGTPSTQELTASLSINSGSESLVENSMPINTFINRNAFFTALEVQTALGPGNSVTLASNASQLPVDAESSFIASVPGLEQYDYITWGRWLSTEETESEGSSKVQTMGYFGGGKTHVAGALQQIPDAALMAATANPIVNYSGAAIGSLMNNSATLSLHGTSKICLNFDSLAVTGTLDFGSNAFVTLAGTFDAANATLAGTASLGSGSIGSFKAGAYADEIAGAFGAKKANDVLTGGFGAKADRSVILKSR